MGANSGSREPSPSASALTGFDPGRKSTAADLDKWRWAFIDRRADFITIDGWVGEGARERVSRAVEDGLLREDARTSARESDEQYTAICFRPTDKLLAILSEIPNERP